MIYYKGHYLVLLRDVCVSAESRRSKKSWWAVIAVYRNGILYSGPTKGACMRAIDNRFTL
jgi:hypothetical protein